ncbi:MAG: chemotaxis protein CheB [Gemmatimonadales bacterium]
MAYSAFDVVALAASSGGIAALPQVLRSLPPDFPSVVTLVQHVGAASPGLVPNILARDSGIPVAHALDREPLKPGRVYVAPPDRHLFITRDRCVMLTRSTRVRFCRPAADPLFVSAAGTWGSRCLGVVLTGASNDGAAGVQAIKWAGGMSIAQDPNSAAATSMPRAAIATGCVDLVLPLHSIGPAIVALVMARGAADFLRVPLRAA